MSLWNIVDSAGMSQGHSSIVHSLKRFTCERLTHVSSGINTHGMEVSPSSHLPLASHVQFPSIRITMSFTHGELTTSMTTTAPSGGPSDLDQGKLLAGTPNLSNMS